MDSEDILTELSAFLPSFKIEELRLAHVLKGSPSAITLCMNINDIIKIYNSTEENEKAVCLLLCDLCSIHFSKQ